MSAGFLVIPIVLPVLAGICVLCLRFKNRKQREALIAASVIINSLVLLALILCRPQGGLAALQLMGEFSVAFRMDGLSCIFCGLIGLLWPLAAFYAFEYMGHEENQTRFFGFYTMSYGVTVGIAMSANLITMYLFYELLTLATLPLVAHEMDKRAVFAGRKYMIYSIGGAALAFVGIMILYCYGTTDLGFLFGGHLQAGAENQPILLLGYLFTFLGFGVKAAVFPLHGWLPTAGVAPTPVTALLHAVAVVKAGIFAVVRSTYYCFGAGFLSGTWVQYVTMALAIITILFGSTMALREQHIKRRLAYSTVSNLSYILFGITLLTGEGLTAALSHMLFHGLMKVTLFFCAGTIICKTHREYVDELEGFGARMPVTMVTFTVASLALAGIPPLPGFVSKLGLITSAMQSGIPLAVAGMAVLMASALLTAAYLFSVVVKAFFPHKGFRAAAIADVKDPGCYMKAPFAILCVVMVVAGIFARPLLEAIGQLVAGAL